MWQLTGGSSPQLPGPGILAWIVGGLSLTPPRPLLRELRLFSIKNSCCLLFSFPHCLITPELNSLPQNVSGGPDSQKMTCVRLCSCSGDKHCRCPLEDLLPLLNGGPGDKNLSGLLGQEAPLAPVQSPEPHHCLLGTLDLCSLSKMELYVFTLRERERTREYEHYEYE